MYCQKGETRHARCQEDAWLWHCNYLVIRIEVALQSRLFSAMPLSNPPEIETGVGKVVDNDPWGSKTELKGPINLWGSEGGRLRIYMVEAGSSHANAILTKQRNRLDLENCGDLRLKLTNFEPNINSLAAAHQAHPSH
ncbi:hypothetical protein FHG87_003001 [Trinorchestia longiramus]|nr:hypothetical protein FHG87_003001 [Trinorchestia longiramus]